MKFKIKSFTKFTGKHLCQSLFVNKNEASGLRPATFLKKRPWHRCIPVNFVKFLRTPFLQNISGRHASRLSEAVISFPYYVLLLTCIYTGKMKSSSRINSPNFLTKSPNYCMPVFIQQGS